MIAVRLEPLAVTRDGLDDDLRRLGLRMDARRCRRECGDGSAKREHVPAARAFREGVRNNRHDLTLGYLKGLSKKKLGGPEP